jgi:ER degradation enhancer, mannosidase alpha-like 1
MGDHKGFEQAVRNVIEWVQYDVDTKPQVFEVTIRALGGLLSGHIVGFYPEIHNRYLTFSARVRREARP